MNRPSIFALALAASTLLPLSAAYADDVDSSHPMNFVKDSAITTAIKTKLATEHLKSLKNIRVDTDDKGIVWLSGYASTDYDVKRAEAVARDTSGVRAVKNDIVVKTE